MDLITVTDFVPATEAAWRRGDAWLGGGTWLYSVPQPGLTRLLDLSAFGWAPVTETPDEVVVSATCTLAELARWQPSGAGYRPAAVLARQCCHALLGSFKVQNVATVGGNICLSLPAGPMTSFASALDAVAELRGPGGAGRRLPVADLVTGDGRNALGPGELLTRLRVPGDALRARTAFRQLSLSPAGRSAVLVIGRRDPGGLVVVSVTASVPSPVVLRFPGLPSRSEALARLDEAVPRYLDDVHGSRFWRAAMTRRLLGEALAELAG
jgi:CO/xanthine dehydrogenase FAD-binding subunit